jgi:hypothetical protein
MDSISNTVASAGQGGNPLAPGPATGVTTDKDPTIRIRNGHEYAMSGLNSSGDRISESHEVAGDHNPERCLL